MSAADYQPSGKVLPIDFEARAPLVEDRLELASLMMDAYVGTIDYEGETEDQAAEEVDGYFRGEAYLDVSRLAVSAQSIQSAVLVSRLAGVPIVGYAMTRAAAKGRGLASALLDASMSALWNAGHAEVRAFITEGNAPSERIFLRAGFTIIATYSED